MLAWSLIILTQRDFSVIYYDRSPRNMISESPKTFCKVIEETPSLLKLLECSLSTVVKLSLPSRMIFLPIFLPDIYCKMQATFYWCFLGQCLLSPDVDIEMRGRDETPSGRISFDGEEIEEQGIDWDLSLVYWFGTLLRWLYNIVERLI